MNDKRRWFVSFNVLFVFVYFPAERGGYTVCAEMNSTAKYEQSRGTYLPSITV